MRLTSTNHDLPAGKADVIHFDDELTGFGLRLRRGSGGKVIRNWIVQYRDQAHRSRRVLIGAVEKLAPHDARKAAKKVLAAVALGGDPQGDKARARQESARSVRSVVDAYLDARRSELRPVSLRVTRLYLAGPYFRSLHPLGIASVTRADVASAVRSIVGKHSATTAAAARRALSAFFSWAIAEGLLGNGANPIDGSFSPEGPAARDRVLSNDELAAIWRACLDNDFGKIAKLLILLGSRRQEVGGMRWSEIDLDTGLWSLPAERSKNHRPHAIILPASALEIVRSVPSVRDTLFGDRSGAGFTNWSRDKQQLNQRLSGAVKPWRLHDIRRSVATHMADLGVEPHVIEACLNHFGGHRAGVAGVYNRASYSAAIERALQRWAAHVDELVNGKKAAKVLELHRR